MNHSLIVSVGGSHEPILQAIRQVQPQHTVFICSHDDPTTGRPGSYTQITQPGNAVIKARNSDDKASLPNIPTQLGLSAEQYSVIKVHADEFDDVYQHTINAIRQQQQQNHVSIDYTGGTKTMSAALVAAALDSPNVSVQLVTGGRADLVKVHSGAETAQPASVENTRVQRQIHEHTRHWAHHAYAETQQQLSQIRLGPGASAQLRGQLNRAIQVSAALAAWDRFDHHSAKNLLEPFRRLLGSHYPHHYTAIETLTGDSPGHQPMQLFDLWRNAQRRATQHRYDDAIARLYRLTEWSAQWLLEQHTGIKTADVPADKIPPGIHLSTNQKGQHQAGLSNAWALAAHHLGGPLQQFWQAQEKTLLNLLQTRNHSILAHGFNPISHSDWHAYENWVQNKLIPLLLNYANQHPYRIKTALPQLPTHYPEEQSA